MPWDESAHLKPGWIADTPGFSLQELRHPEPAEVCWQFPELADFAGECKYANCLHVVEDGCNVILNLEKIPAQRYQSYITIVGEAQQEAKLRNETSQKVETGVLKYVGGKGSRGTAVPKLSHRYRTTSRRKDKQQWQEHDHEEDEAVDEPPVEESSDEVDDV